MSSNKMMALLAWLFSLVGFPLLCAAKDFQNIWMWAAGGLFNIASIPLMLKLVWKADRWDDK